MSSRIRKRPDTFQKQQENEAKKKSVRKVKKITRTQKPTGTKTPAIPKTPGALKRKRPNVNIFNVLNQVGKNNKTKAFNMLYSIYKSTNLPKLNKTISSLKNKTIEELINEQYVILKNNVRSNGTINTLNLKLSETDKLDFCLLIWLDMRHDAKDSMKDVSFKNFLDSNLLKMIIKNPPAFQITDLMKKMKHFKIISEDFERPGQSNWERRIKDNLPELFGIKEPNKVSSHTDLKLDPKNPINISIDSEGSKSAISMLIANNKTQVNNKTTRYTLRSIISIANRVDPGNTMPTGGVQQEWTKLFDNSGNLKSTQIYNVSDCKFKIGDTNLELTSGTKGTFNMTVNGNLIKVGSTAKSVGASNASNEVRISKFLGDFMQILTVCSEPQSGKVTALATVDGVASGIYTFISKRLMKQEPRLFIDMYIEQGNYIDVYGFSHLLNTRRKANQSVINTYKSINKKGNNNMKNNANSNRSRTVSVNSVSNGNRTISGNSRNSTISGNSGNSTNTNMVQPLRKKQKPANNTLSVASAIRNNKNKNNNEVTSGNKNAIAKMRTLNPKFNMGTNPKTKKKSFFPFPVRRKVTPTKPKPLLNQSINNARAELNKLTSLRQNQKNNYLEKMKQDPINILRILSNAKQVASRQRATRSRASAK